MNHLHYHSDVLLGSQAQIMFEVTFPLQLEHHFLNGWALPAYAAKSVPQGMGLAPQGILNERFALRIKDSKGREREEEIYHQPG